MTPVKQILSARRRCVRMGRPHGWTVAFDTHPLAASIDNHTYCIDHEMALLDPDYLSVLVWTLKMAQRINRFCDEHKVLGDSAAEYWLERFLWSRGHHVVDFEALAG